MADRVAASEQPPRVPPEEPEPGEIEEMRRWMSRAIHTATEAEDDARSAGVSGCLNAALIVNPATGVLVASGRDTTRGWRVEGGAPDARVGHPLRHAVFEAVDAAAARDLEVHGPDAPPPRRRRRAGGWREATTRK